MKTIKKLLCKFKGHKLQRVTGFGNTIPGGAFKIFPTSRLARKYGAKTAQPKKLNLRQCTRCKVVMGGALK